MRGKEKPGKTNCGKIVEVRVNLGETGMGRVLSLRIPVLFNLRCLMKLTHCHFHRFSAVVSIKQLWSSLIESHQPVRVVWYGYLGRNHSNKTTNSL